MCATKSILQFQKWQLIVMSNDTNSSHPLSTLMNKFRTTAPECNTTTTKISHTRTSRNNPDLLQYLDNYITP